MAKYTNPSIYRLPSKPNAWDAMRALYASEINCGLASFWDGGFTVWLGDHINGHDAKTQFFDEHFDHIPLWLHAEALRLYPNSTFAAFNPTAEHMHIAGEHYPDQCAACHRDIRDPIHVRSKP